LVVEVAKAKVSEIFKKANEDTACKDKLGYGLALRFPRIVSKGIREDKSPEDATTTKEVIEMYKMQKDYLHINRKRI